ncbi:uncharacterized protein LOC127004602 [Eriocheir sinensis]|uniref:uncharacterized protein LOC127004602 n=1 Tax=Eriocheir sinensis TaxID=95602 RepID=UPI0021C8A486|nr:uncharacterized protein LOC127004602 [Eriocheir sinensis]XP_050728550.1 uncharacterized protein LOC127004602 [Eriocheir sinensis]XP_050728551.1 uncharacterized protein LOC127004602 [Eriocheir sinensis]
MDLLPQAPAALTPREPPGEAPNHYDSAKPVASQNIPVEVSLRTTEEEVAGSSAAAGRQGHTAEALGAPTQAVPDVGPAVSHVEASCCDNHKQTANLNCTHLNFPSCDCVARAAKHRPTHGRLGRRAGRRPHRGPSLAALRDSGLEAFDENEESDFQESETETDPHLADTTDAESDCTAGLESDVEGAVGGPELLAPPDIPGGRRASIVTTDSRHDEILTAPEPIKVAVFGTDGVGKSALIVRLLTGRFIGEYDPTLEAVYSYQIPLPGHTLPLQVMDTAGHVEVAEDGRERQVSWGEGFMLVFSLTSHASFTALNHLRRVILELTPGSPRPMVLVGNKADLAHAREVTDHEIRDMASKWDCDYFEVAAPEPWEVVVRPFAAIYQAVLNTRETH